MPAGLPDTGQVMAALQQASIFPPLQPSPLHSCFLQSFFIPALQPSPLHSCLPQHPFISALQESPQTWILDANFSGSLSKAALHSAQPKNTLLPLYSEKNSLLAGLPDTGQVMAALQQASAIFPQQAPSPFFSQCMAALAESQGDLTGESCENTAPAVNADTRAMATSKLNPLFFMLLDSFFYVDSGTFLRYNCSIRTTMETERFPVLRMIALLSIYA